MIPNAIVVSDEMPECGQFVAIWPVESGVMFSATILIKDGLMYAYNSFEDEWDYEHGFSKEFFESKSATFHFIEAD